MTDSPRNPGPAADRFGNPIGDPSKNVLDLTVAAVRRLDDLSAQYIKRIDDLQQANDQLSKARDRRQDDLRQMQADHFREVSAIRADYESKLRIAESQRIDAIRAVDVGNVSRAAEVASTIASTLAAQVQTSAVTLRGQVDAAAAAAVVNLSQAVSPIQESIAELRRLQYEQQGQKAAQTETRSTQGSDRSYVLALVLGGISLAGVIIALLFDILRSAPVNP